MIDKEMMQLISHLFELFIYTCVFGVLLFWWVPDAYVAILERRKSGKFFTKKNKKK